MLTTGGVPEYDDYHFKNSPESSTDSFMTDYFDLNSDEDFLQQLSSDLDIPLLLNSNEDELGMLNSILDKSPDEILSEITSPILTTNCQDFGNEINELQHLDLTQWGPDAFPNLKAECNIDYIKSESPTPSHSSDDSKYCGEVKEEIIIDTPPISPNSNTIHINLPSNQSSIVKNANTQFIGRSSSAKRNIFHNKAYLKNKKKILLSPNLTNQNILPVAVNNSLNNNVLIIESTKLPINSMQNLQTNNTTANLVNINSCIPLTGLPMIVNQAENMINSNATDIDTRALKRQQRMIKNRESAILSRKKKKEYLTTLEKQVQELTLENALLKKENANLKDRLSVLSQNITSVFKLPNKTLTKSMALCIFLFVVCLNLDFASKQLNFKTNNLEPDSTVQLTNRHTRNLLWTQDIDSEKPVINETANIVSLPICPMNVNQTESVRLALELHRWIGKPYNDSINMENQYQMKSKSRLKYRSKLRLKSRSESLNSPIISSVYRMGKRLKSMDAQMSGNELQLFEPTPEQLYAEFFEAINRKDDTFYVVSFNADHMLLPALNHNKTRRPKMALILPSMIANDANHTRGISLMQIDCEVIDTRLINVKDNAIPEHFKPSGNTTNSPNKHQKMGVRQKLKKPYKPYFMNKIQNSTLNVHKLP